MFNHLQALQETSCIYQNTGKFWTDIGDGAAATFYIIHPVLKHRAILRRMDKGSRP